MPTLIACVTAVAIVIPTRTGHGLYLAEKAIAINWLLSPSSATKITPKLNKKADNT
jgi:hypothetical protein